MVTITFNVIMIICQITSKIFLILWLLTGYTYFTYNHSLIMILWKTFLNNQAKNGILHIIRRLVRVIPL